MWDASAKALLGNSPAKSWRVRVFLKKLVRFCHGDLTFLFLYLTFAEHFSGFFCLVQLPHPNPTQILLCIDCVHCTKRWLKELFLTFPDFHWFRKVRGKCPTPPSKQGVAWELEIVQIVTNITSCCSNSSTAWEIGKTSRFRDWSLIFGFSYLW